MAVKIERANLDDLPALAEINRLSYMGETISMFAFKDWPDEKNMREFFMARLRIRFDTTGTQVFKATDARTSKIVGFVCWTLEQGETADAKLDKPLAASKTPTASLVQVEQMPPFLHRDFVIKTGAEVEELREFMKGEKHYCKFSSCCSHMHPLATTQLERCSRTITLDISAFAVEPGFQGQGIGSELLKYCFQMSDQEGLRTWLISFPGFHSLYLRFSFTDLDYGDIDLNE